MRRFLPLLIFLGMVTFLYLGLGIDTKRLPSPLIGKPYPVLELTDLATGKALSSQASLKGQPTLVNVWASWCLTCLAEHQELLEISQQNNIRLVGINYKDNKKDAKRFLILNGNPFEQIIFDPLGKLGLDLGVYATPETFIIDKKGIVRYKHIGEITTALIKQTINPLIEKIKEE